MRKIDKGFFIAWSIIAVLVFANVAVATTISTNITTTGTLDVTGATTLTGLLKVVNASVSGDFELTTNDGDIIAMGDLTIEDITASGSQTITGTLGVTGATTLTGLLKAVNASVSGNFEVGGSDKFKITATSGNIAAIGDLLIEDITASASIGAVNASLSGRFTVASDGTFGATTASISGVDFQVLNTTGTVSIGFDGAGVTGTCFVVTNTAGTLTYCRVIGTTFTCDTNSCK